MKFKNYSANTTFYDMLMNMTLLFVALFCVALIQIKLDNSKKNIESKAEMLLSIEWPTDDFSDVDMYLECPDGKIVYFSSKDSVYGTLVRDDLGVVNDELKIGNTVVSYNHNEEAIILRKTTSGEWVFNVHMFRKDGREPMTTVKCKVEKLNPSYNRVLEKTVDLYVNGDEVTVCRFRLDDAGNIQEVNDLEKKLTKLKQQTFNASEEQ